jgi:hypothetical protein
MAALATYLLRGALAGAAGTTALNAATYADMALRARPASSTPEQTVERGAGLVGLPLPDDPDKRQARESGLGSLLGAVVGVGAGATLGALRHLTGHPRGTVGTVGTAWLLAMMTGNAPMTLLGVTDPRSWSPADWASDVVPHLAYALVAAATLNGFQPARRIEGRNLA